MAFFGGECVSPAQEMNSGEILVIPPGCQSLLQSALLLFSPFYSPSPPFCTLSSSQPGIPIIATHYINFQLHLSVL